MSSYFGVSITVKGINFKRVYQSKVDAEIHISIYFRRVGRNDDGYPFTIVRSIHCSFEHPVRNANWNYSTCIRGEWSISDKAWFYE